MDKISRYTLIVTTIIFLVLSSMLVSANVNNFGLEYNYLPITKISLSHPVTVTTVFNVEAEFQPYKIVVNFSDLVQNPYYKQNYEEYTISGSSCHFDNETSNYKCGLINTVINPESANVNLNFEVFYTAYNSSQYPISHTFDIDNDSPALTDITTDYCNGDKCYIKSGSNKIYFNFDDSSENFVRRKVFYSMENSRYPVSYCLNGECYSAMTKICTSGQYYQIKLVTSGNYKSEDDAGNPIISNDLARNIYCDSIIPYSNMLGDNNFYELSTGEEVENSNIEFVGDANSYGLISGGKPLTIKAYVFEDGPIVYAEANLSSIGGSNEEIACVKQESNTNLHLCEFSVGTLLNEHLQQTINFKFTDIVNNTFSTSKEITILHSPGSDVATPDCVEIKEEDFYPKKINRIALDLSQTNSLSYPTYAPYTPERKSGSFCRDAEISEQKIEDCWIVTYNGSLMPALGNYFDDSSNINHPYWKLGESNFIDLPISVDPNAIDSTTLICNISFNVYDDKNIYSEPLIKTIEWDVILLNSKLGRPGENYVETLKDTTQNLEKTGNTVLGALNDGLATASKMCKAGNFLKDTLNNLQVASDVVDFGVGLLYEEYRNKPATSNALKPALAIVNGKDYKEVKSGVTGALSNVFEMSCWASSCSLANYMKSTSIEDGNAFQDASKAYNEFSSEDLGVGIPTNSYDGGINDFDTWNEKLGKDLLGNIGTPDLYNSVLACVSTGCVPGIVYHVNQWRESECDYLYCLKRQAQYGLSIDACEVSKRTFTCKKIVGEVFEFPVVREVKNLADNFNHLAQNFVPKILFDVVSDATCTEDYENVVSNPKIKVGDLNIFNIVKCELPLSIGRAIRNKKMTNKLGSFQYPTPEVDICKLALCNEEDQSKCEVESGMTWFNNLLPDEIKSVVNSQDMSSYEHMRMLQSNNRNMMKNKYYVNSLSHYTNLLESCVENGGCDGANDEALRITTEAYNDYQTRLGNEKEDDKSKYTPDEIDEIIGEAPKLSDYDFANDLEKAADRLHYTYNNNFPSSYEEAMKKVGDFKKNNPGLSDLSNKEILKRAMKEEIIFKELGSDYSEIPGGLGDIEFTEPTIDLTNKEIATTETLDSLLGGTLDDEKKLDYESMFADLTQDIKKDLRDNNNYKGSLSGITDKADDYDKAEEEAKKDYTNLVKNPPEYAQKIFEKEFGLNWATEWDRFVNTGKDYDSVLYVVKNTKTDEIISVTETDYIQNYENKGDFILTNGEDIKVNKEKREKVKGDLTTQIEEKKSNIKEYKKKLKSYQTERQKKLDFMQQRNRMKKWIDIAVKWFWNNFVKDFGTLGDIGERYDLEGLTQFSQTLDNYVNSESWKNSLCNPQISGLVDFNPDQGSAIDCTGPTCRTILTMAMERTPYNWSDEHKTDVDQYLYTFVYHMGPIAHGNEYNIYFVDENGNKNCVFKDTNENCKDKTLSIGDIEARSIAFISENYYEEVRFEFKNNFPAPSVKVQTVFKRIITESQFDTGQPDRDFEIADLDSPETGGGVNEVYN